MNRRNFFGAVGAAIAAAVVDRGVKSEAQWEVTDRLPIEDYISAHYKRVEGEFAMAGEYLYVKLPDGNWRRIHALGW